MFILYIFIVVFCCFVTYKITVSKMIKLDKVNIKGFDVHQEYISKALDEIAKIKTDVNQIKEDIYQ